jgi:hypothetical protein
MKLLLKKAARINHKAGEIVEVSPDQARFLLSLNVAEIVEVAEKPAPKRETRKTK